MALTVNRKNAAAALARFAAEALAALQARERDPVEDIERAAHFGASTTHISNGVMFANRDGETRANPHIPQRQTADAAPALQKRGASRGSVRPHKGRDA
jgi:hypothetical protein